MASTHQYISRKEALERVRKFCTYRERCHKEVWDKLYDLNQDPGTASDLITQLIEENFLNEERFARSYVKGKFKHNQWGREKIRQGLKAKGIHSSLIRMAMEEISEEGYLEQVHRLIAKQRHKIKAKNQYDKKAKLARHLLSKGYEQDLVWDIIREYGEHL